MSSEPLLLNALQSAWLTETGIPPLFGVAWEKYATATLSENKSVPEKTSQTSQVLDSEKELMAVKTLTAEKVSTPAQIATSKKASQPVQTTTPEKASQHIQTLIKNVRQKQTKELQTSSSEPPIQLPTQTASINVPAQAYSYVFIEEQPSPHQETAGHPLFGDVGILFDRMLGAMGLVREQVMVETFFSQPQWLGKSPSREQIEESLQVLANKINATQPKCIVAFGQVAKYLCGLSGMPETWRQQTWLFDCAGQKVPVISTYHPSYLLVNPSLKAKAWEDLKQAWQLVNPR